MASLFKKKKKKEFCFKHIHSEINRKKQFVYMGPETKVLYFIFTHSLILFKKMYFSFFVISVLSLFFN